MGRDILKYGVIAGLVVAAGMWGTLLAFGKEMPFVDGKTPGGIPTPEQARARIADLKKDQAFVKRYTTGDAAALKEMTDLHAIAAQG